jgi:chemotaxis signal transduction protein
MTSQTRAGLFKLAGHMFAIDAQGLRQIVTVSSLTKVPRSPQTLMGFFAVRGDILPLIDLHLMLGLTPLANRPTDLAMQLSIQGHSVALSVDEVVGFSFYERSDTEDMSHPQNAFGIASINYDKGQALLLDAARLVETFMGNLAVV